MNDELESRSVVDSNAVV